MTKSRELGNLPQLVPAAIGSAGQQLAVNSGATALEYVDAASGTTVHNTLSDMTSAATPDEGSLHYNKENDSLYVKAPNGFYRIAQITNVTPTISGITAATGGGSASTISSGGTFTLTAGSNTIVEITASDADLGQTLSYSASLISGTLSNVASSFTQGTGSDINKFTIVPSTSTGGTVTYTFSVSDGTQAATQNASFTITFSAALQNVTGYEITHTANGNQNYTLWLACLYDDSGNAPFDSSTLRGDTTHASGSTYQSVNHDAFTEYNYAITNYTGGDSPPSGTSRYMDQYINWSANNVTVSTTWSNSNAIDLKLFYLTGEAYGNNNVGWDGGSVKFYINGVKETNARTLTALPAAADGNSNAHGYYIAFT